MGKTKSGDQRSPKRQAQGQASTPRKPAASAAAELDDAIWTSIIELMPIPKDLHLSDKKKHDTAVSEVLATWRTLLHLRLVSKNLAALLHPRENVALWRRLVLQSFDFSADRSWNVENYQDDDGLDVSSDDEEKEEEEASGSKAGEEADENPQLDDMPSEYLEEDLVSWGSLGIYHRPSQYGFLTTLQQKPPEGEWPESEDPITLFGDLVRLLQLPSGERMNASGGLGNEGIFKCLAAPAGTVDTRLAVHYDVMKTLGYVPHYWHWGRGMGEEWKGATEPGAFETAIAEQSSNKYCGEDASFDKAGLFYISRVLCRRCEATLPPHPPALP